MTDIKNMIFVFGSNLGGIHGAGAAEYARKYRGAVLGTGVGLMGQSYAIPTKDVIRGRVGNTLPLNVIKKYIDEFIEYAEHHHEFEFQVTAIGCGLAGLKHKDIAPMFVDAPMNCYFDTIWKPWLTKASHRFWGTF